LRIFACFLAVTGSFTSGARADNFTPTKIDPDPPERRAPPVVPSEAQAPSWNLDGLYLWLGPAGAASHIDGEWDSTIGADATLVRVREREALGVIGASFGASRWTERGGGRLWLDGLVGTRFVRMVGVSAGPMLELNDLSHPRFGASVGLWTFFGVAPFVRAGMVQDLGGFVEVGLHIMLPVIRR
jgi:hypothetical protein